MFGYFANPQYLIPDVRRSDKPPSALIQQELPLAIFAVPPACSESEQFRLLTLAHGAARQRAGSPGPSSVLIMSDLPECPASSRRLCLPVRPALSAAGFRRFRPASSVQTRLQAMTFCYKGADGYIYGPCFRELMSDLRTRGLISSSTLLSTCSGSQVANDHSHVACRLTLTLPMIAGARALRCKFRAVRLDVSGSVSPDWSEPGCSEPGCFQQRCL